MMSFSRHFSSGRTKSAGPRSEGLLIRCESGSLVGTVSKVQLYEDFTACEDCLDISRSFAVVLAVKVYVPFRLAYRGMGLGANVLAYLALKSDEATPLQLMLSFSQRSPDLNFAELSSQRPHDPWGMVSVQGMT
eukprot:GABU01004822.1.p2 GENE.GABU01004822.1~~GABU01004822.1.p2  ORF type:complete len:134 (-),score=7.72 GABU01004822.1:281-682(-)